MAEPRCDATAENRRGADFESGLHGLALFVVLASALAACGTTSALQPIEPAMVRSDGGVLTRAADLPELREALAESDASEAAAGLLLAEIDIAEGRFGRSFDRCAEVFESAPNTVLGALAVERMVAMSQIIGGFAERVHPLVERFGQGQGLHPLSALFYNALALEAAWAHYTLAEVTRPEPFSAEALGLPDVWRVSGPYSRFPLAHLTRREAFDGDILLADAYAPDGRELETRLVLGSGPVLRPSLPDAGTHVFETWAHTTRGGDALVALEAGVGAQVSVDAEVVLTRRETGPYQARTQVGLIHLEPGWHRVRMRLGWEGDGEAEVRLRLVPIGAVLPDLAFSERPAESASLGAVRLLWHGEDFLEAVLPPDVLAPDGPLEAYLLLRFATSFGRGELADPALPLLQTGDADSPVVAVAVARLAGERQNVAPTERHNQRMAAMREALETAPSAHGIALPLISQLSSDGRDDEATRLVGTLGDWLTTEPSYWLSVYELYTRRRWDELAEDALETALALEPGACYALRELLDLYAFRDHYPEPDSWPPAVDSCRDGLLYQVEWLLLPRGRTDEALAMLELLAARDPSDTRVQRRRFELLMGLGRRDEALALLPEMHRYGLSESELALLETDWLLAAGREDDARARLARALREDTPGDYPLLRIDAMLRGDRVLDDLRVDSAEAIARYRAQGQTPRTGAVYALDYGAYRYYPDGSSVALVHQIMHITSRDALGSYGEVTVPAHALLLRARTIKADGTMLEPDNIPGKDAISMPNLEVGDFIEYEYVELTGPSRLRPHTVVGPRFYFQVFDAPMAHSEMIIDVPAAWDELVFDIRAGAPEPAVTVGDEWRRYRFVVEGGGLPIDENGAPDADERLPSVRYVHDYTWDDVREQFIERRLAVVRVTPELRAAAESLVRGVEDDREAVRRIFRHVVDHFEETGGFLSTEAEWTWRQGEGERLPLLLGLLEAAGYSADLVFLKTAGDDTIRSPVPDPDEVPNTAVRVRLGDDSVWLEPNHDYAPFDYLRPELQDVDAMVMETTSANGSPGAEWLTSPSWPPASNRQEVEVTVVLDETGGYTAEAVELIPMRNAAGTRQYLEQLQDERLLVQDLEAGLSSSFPAVVVDDVQVEGQDAPDEPLLMRYTFHGRGLGEVIGERLRIDRRIFDRHLRAMLGAQASRVNPLVLDYPFAERVRLTLELPVGYTFSEVPAGTEVAPPWLSYSMTVEEGGLGQARVTLRRETRLAVGRVAPDEYPLLLEALHQIDEAESLRFWAGR